MKQLSKSYEASESDCPLHVSYTRAMSKRELALHATHLHV